MCYCPMLKWQLYKVKGNTNEAAKKTKTHTKHNRMYKGTSEVPEL